MYYYLTEICVEQAVCLPISSELAMPLSRSTYICIILQLAWLWVYYSGICCCPNLVVFLYVTGFWKTDRIVTLGLLHFIGPANSYTCTLHIQSAITRLGWLVCFSKVSFADPVNSWLRQWDPWGALHGRHGSEIHSSDGETSLTPFKHVWTYGWHFWDL